MRLLTSTASASAFFPRGTRRGAGRRILLQGQDRAHRGRLLGRRRLRPLRTRAGAAYRPPHPGQSECHRAEHAGRREPQFGEVHVRRRADRRHPDQRIQPRPDHAVADGAAESRHQLPRLWLGRQHQRGFPRLPHLERHRHQDLAGLAGATEGHHGQHRGRHLGLYRQPHPERPVRREAAAGDGLSRQRRQAHRDRARRARRRLRLVDQPAGRMAAASARSRSTSAIRGR